MKKVLTAALLCTVSAFAAWDKFPVIEYGKGEAKAFYYKSRQANDGDLDFDFAIRYSPLANLELASYWGGIEGNYALGLRYQIIPVLSAGVDVGFPLPGTAWSFTPNAQFSTEVTSALSLGSNVEATISTKDADKTTNGIDLAAGIELDLALSEKSTIWVGFDFGMGVTDTDYDGNKVKAKEDGRGTKLSPGIGYIATISNLALGTSVGFDFGEKSGNKPFNTTVGLDAAVQF